MTSTRLLTIVAFALGSAGLVMVSMSENLPISVLGATMMVASAITFVRHFWRESERKRQQDLTSYEGALRTAIANMPLDQLHKDVSSVNRRIEVFTQGVLEYMAQLELDVAEGHSVGTRRLDEMERASIKRFDSLDRVAARYRDQILTQIAGIVGVYSTLNPSTPYPNFGGWAIGGDCAQRLVSLILTRRPRHVVEAGSGLSTVLAAQALELLGDEGQVISFEHESQWLERSRALVAEHRMSHRCQILYTPLVEVPIGDEVFLWYDLSEVELPEEVQLIFIDGPPKATGPLARYPAAPILLDRLVVGGVILMDDAGRAEERAAIERWSEEFPDLSFQYHHDAKGTVEIIKGKR